MTRLEEAPKSLRITSGRKKCVGTRRQDLVVDLGLFGAGSRVEHYEFAGYMTPIALSGSCRIVASPIRRGGGK